MTSERNVAVWKGRIAGLEKCISKMEKRVDNVTRLLDVVVYTMGEVILQLESAPLGEWDGWKRNFEHEYALLLSERVDLVKNLPAGSGPAEGRIQELRGKKEAADKARLDQVAKDHRALLARNRRAKARAKTLWEKYQEQAGKPVDANAKQENKRNAKDWKS